MIYISEQVPLHGVQIRAENEYCLLSPVGRKAIAALRGSEIRTIEWLEKPSRPS